ncbi:MAG: serine/threonine-protein kinase [Bryobacteraceae bacterium]
MTFESGTRIGDYEVIAPLGAGGMGQVYKVRNLIADRMEAMKILLPDLANAPDLAERFLREIRVQANLDHPNIAKLHTALRIDNQLLMFMEFMEGTSLDRRLRDGRIPPSDAIDYIAQVLSALDYAHKQGVVHRDIKPANMMLMPNGIVKLMDFGIAKATAEHGLTATGTTLGSLYYMSPEQIQGSATDARSDLYSVGVSLYELVTARKPFEGKSEFSIMSAHLEKPPVPPVELEKDIPPALSELIVMSLNRDPAGRFQTAAAFGNALRSLQPEAVHAAAASPAPARTAVPPASSLRATAPTQPLANPAAAPPAAAAAAAPRSHRGLWISLGGLCAVLAIIAVVQFGPWKSTSAGQNLTPAHQDTPAPTSPVPAQTAPDSQSSPVPVPAAAPAEQPPAAHTPGVTLPVRTPSSTPRVKNKIPEASAPAATSATAPPLQQPAPSTPAQAAPVEPAAPAVDNQQLQKLRDEWTMMEARAGSIRSTLQGLARSQAAQGLSLRGDWQRAATLMDSFMQQADGALNGMNQGVAKSSLEKAERQIEFLEKALNK